MEPQKENLSAQNKSSSSAQNASDTTQIPIAQNPQPVIPNPIQNIPNPTANIPTPPPAKSKGKLILIIAVVILLFSGAIAAAYFLGMQKSNNKTSETPQRTTVAKPSTVPAITQTPSPTIENTTQYTSQKLPNNSLNPYSISFPASWTKENKRTDGIMDSLTLTKGKYLINIYQAPMGGSQCIFEGNLPEGPAQDYRTSKFTEIKTDTIIYRRILQTTSDPSTVNFSFCANNSENPASYGTPTSFGSITYTTPSTPDDNMLNEMDNIIKSLAKVTQ